MSNFVNNDYKYGFDKLAYLLKIGFLDLKKNNYAREYFCIQNLCKYTMTNELIKRGYSTTGDNGKVYPIKAISAHALVDENTQPFEKVLYKITRETYKSYNLLVALNHEEGTYKINLVNPNGESENLVTGIYNPAKLKTDKYTIANKACEEYFKYSYLDGEYDVAK